MKIDILKMEDTEDGGAIISVEVDREVLHLAFEYWLNSVLQARIDEAFIEAAARGLVEEEGITTQADTGKEKVAWDDIDYGRTYDETYGKFE